MTGFCFARLDDRALLAVTGGDAEKFLQALITCDIDHLAPGQGNFGALLTPQGKILFDFFVVRTGEGFLLDVDAGMRDDLAKRLGFYKLRAKVEIAANDAMHVHAIWGEALPEVDGIVIADPRIADLGYRLYSVEAATEPAGETADFDAHRIAHGMPQGGRDYLYGDSFPHEALMDQFGGVDFAKGCYIGQEVVSRMQHRGTARKRVVMVSSDAALPPPGTPVEAGGKPAGTMGSSTGHAASGAAGLAMLRLDRVREALDHGAPVTAGGGAISVTLQPWVTFGWPQA